MFWNHFDEADKIDLLRWQQEWFKLNLFLGFQKPKPLGKILLLHGWMSTGSAKSSYLRFLGYDVQTPQLSNWWFGNAKRAAQKVYDEFKPDAIVGSSRGGAVAMSIESGQTPMVLLAPAWNGFGCSVGSVKSNTIIIHSSSDDVVSYQDSVNLSKRCGVKLITAGKDHRLNCMEGQKALKEALAELVPQPRIT